MGKASVRPLPHIRKPVAQALPAILLSAIVLFMRKLGNRGDDDGGDVGLGGVEFAVAFGGRADGGKFIVTESVGEATEPPAGNGHVGGGERQG